MSKSLKIALLAILVLGVSGISNLGVVRAQFAVFLPKQGGTGTGVIPTYGQLLVGQSNGVYALVATSTLGITAASVPSAISANSVYANPTGVSAIPTGVATSSLITGTGISFSGSPGSLVGGTALTITNTGLISALCSGGTTCSGTNPISISSFSYPFPSNATTTALTVGGLTITGLSDGCLKSTTGVVGSQACGSGTITSIALGGGLDGLSPITTSGTITAQLATSSVPSISSLLYVTGNGTPTTVSGVATSSINAGTGVTFSGTPGGLVGGTALTINTPWTISGSNIYNNNTANVGIGTTTPTGNFSIQNNYDSANSTIFSIASSTNAGATTASTLLTITSTGFVGVGTTSPSQSAVLGVSGNIFTSGTAYANNFYDTSAAGSSCIGDLAGLLENGNCVASIKQTYGSAQTGAITLATSTTAINNDWGITNAAGTFTFNLPTATASIRGLLSGTDFTTFNSKVSSQWTTSGSNISYTTGNVGIGTTTPFTALGVTGTITANSINATTTNATSTFSGGLVSTGEHVGQDIANAWSGQINPTHTLVYPAATSTATWTGTSTPGVDAAVPVVFTFKGILRDIYCTSNSFLGVQVKINSTVTTPAYRIASSTANVNAITANNTFNIGDILTLNFGTTTSATASAPVYASCSLDVTQTP